MAFVFERCPDGHRCNNGSVCIEVEDGVFSCDCNAIQDNVFAGLSCEHKATVFCNDQNSISRNSFCTNGGKCTEMVNDQEAHFACDCKEGYMGDHCEYTEGANLPDHAKDAITGKTGSSDGLSSGAVAGIVLVVLATVLTVGLFMIRKRLRQWDPMAARSKDDIRAAPELHLDADGSVLTSAVRSGAGVNGDVEHVNSPVYADKENGDATPAAVIGGEATTVDTAISPTSVSSNMENGLASPMPAVETSPPTDSPPAIQKDPSRDLDDMLNGDTEAPVVPVSSAPAPPPPAYQGPGVAATTAYEPPVAPPTAEPPVALPPAAEPAPAVVTEDVATTQDAPVENADTDAAAEPEEPSEFEIV